MKKLDKMEDLSLDFELRAAEDEKLKGFLAEVQQKLDGMIEFKKSFLSFEKIVELYLKKVAPVSCCEVLHKMRL